MVEAATEAMVTVIQHVLGDANVSESQYALVAFAHLPRAVLTRFH